MPANTAATTAAPPFDKPDPLFDENGPINPLVVIEAVRSVIRAMPHADREPKAWADRRMYAAMSALSSLQPRDEIELMLGVQALCAYHAACALWRVGMNLRQPAGDSTRHITAAANAARTFDSLLKAVERRQAKPLAAPVGRPDPRPWPPQDPAALIDKLATRARADTDDSPGLADPEVVWTPEAIALANTIAEQTAFAEDYGDLDLANTEGIRPDGSMIVPAVPTAQQDAYMARRNGLNLKREWAENKRKGIKQYPKIRPIRTGDLIP
jgi:hypothetical protein